MWKDIKGYEGLYQVSDSGQVRNRKGRILKGQITKLGYHQQRLCLDSSCLWKLVHRLVAEAFIANHKEFPVINHLDCNKLNNNVTNLEWTSQASNLVHARDQGMSYHKINMKIATEIRKSWALGTSHVENARIYHISPTHVSMIVRFKRWKPFKGVF